MIKVKFMKVISSLITSTGMEFKYIPMVMFILGTSKKIRSTAMVNSTGLVYLLQLNKMLYMYSITMGDGGEVYQMGLGLTKNRVGIFMMENLRMG